MYMKTARFVRLATALIDAFLLLAGSVLAIVLSAAGVQTDQRYLWSTEVLAIIGVCFFLLFVLIETISAFTISDSTWHTVLIAISLLGFHLTGGDFIRIMFGAQAGIFATVGRILNFAFFECVFLGVVLFWDYTFKLGLSRRYFVFLGVLFALWLGLYAALIFYDAEIAGFLFAALTCAAALVYVYRRTALSTRTDKTFIASEALFFSLAGSMLSSQICFLQNSASDGVTAFHAIPVILIFLSIYAAFAMRTDRAALKASEYKLQYERIKARALKEQIKPHFVFNVLAAIQSLYRSNVDEGDRAVTLLARHLRTNIEATDVDFIPFEKELDNVQVLVDLENMRLGKAFNIIYDIDCTDFAVPILSLQPYLENAIKYSRVNEKEDGFILISTRREKDGILLVVADNGVGFDPAAVSASSCGIRNSSERLSMLMGVTPEIESAPGKGTTVRIFIKNSTPPRRFSNY